MPYKRVRDYEWIAPRIFEGLGDELFLDLAIYGAKQRPGHDEYAEIEHELDAIGGLKTLISHNRYDEEAFWRTWNKPNYDAVKKITDPDNVFRDLYEKTCRATQGRLAFEDAERHEARHLARDAGAHDDVDDALDVFVGDGRLLGELGVRRAADDDAARLELLAESPPRVTVRFAARAAHRAAGAVARARERELARRVGADEDERRRAHAAGDEHGLPDGCGSARGASGLAGTERARRALAVHAELAGRRAPRSSRCCARRRRRRVEASRRRRSRRRPAADAVGEHLTVGEREVRGGAHRREVVAPLGRRERRARELAIGQRDAVARERRVHRAHVVGAHLVAEAARAGVDEHRDLALAKRPRASAASASKMRVDALDLEEVVAAAERRRADRARAAWRARRPAACARPRGSRRDSMRSRSSARPRPRSRTSHGRALVEHVDRAPRS